MERAKRVSQVHGELEHVGVGIQEGLQFMVAEVLLRCSEAEQGRRKVHAYGAGP